MSVVRSAKGKIVDFGLLRIKQTMQNAIKPESVEEREEVIESKRRRTKKRTSPNESIVDESSVNENDDAETDIK